jgi:hypothetical protein
MNTKNALHKKLKLKYVALALGGVMVALIIIAVASGGNSDSSGNAQPPQSSNKISAEAQSSTPNLAEADVPTKSPAVANVPTDTNVAVAGKVGDASLYPNPTLTPGDVMTTDASIVCVSGYTATVRDVPLSEKKQVYAEYGVSYPQPTGAYEVDHFIPLELGGSNDIKNLWLEPAAPIPGFHQKDQYENYGHKQACDGEITLIEAQRRMTTDWYKYWLQETGATTVQTQQSATITTATTTPTTASTSTNTSSPAVKKSSTGICHAQGTTYYDRTTNYTPYDSIDACLASGGRLPQK